MRCKDNLQSPSELPVRSFNVGHSCGLVGAIYLGSTPKMSTDEAGICDAFFGTY